MAMTLENVQDILKSVSDNQSLYVNRKGEFKTQGFLGRLFTLSSTQQRTAATLLNIALEDKMISLKSKALYTLLFVDRGDGFYVKDLNKAIIKIQKNNKKLPDDKSKDITIEDNERVSSDGDKGKNIKGASPSLVDFIVKDYYASSGAYSFYVDYNNKVKAQGFWGTLFTSDNTWQKTNKAFKKALVKTFGEDPNNHLELGNTILKGIDILEKTKSYEKAMKKNK